MKEDATLKYQMWLDWFITDNKLDIEEVLFEGKVSCEAEESESEDGEESENSGTGEAADEDGEAVRVTLEQFLQKSLEMPGWQADIRRFSMKAQYVGTDVLEKIREMCREKVKKGFFNT
ncbi:MAG: hypothetical protein K2K54_00470 [Lachnospiraceae bacterium]|nr:hypothetical protein [Lachnospiraceae bacterium]